MPYRKGSPPVRARFELRTPPGFFAVGAALAVLSLSVVGLLVWAHFEHGMGPPFMYAFGAVALLLVPAWWRGSGPYRIGGTGALVVHEDHIEVPGTSRGDVVRLPLEGLAFERTPVRVGWLGLITFRRGELITLRSGSDARVVSTLTSPEPDFADRLAASFGPPYQLANVLAECEQLFDMVRPASDVGANAGPSEDALERERDAELERRIDAELHGQ